MSRTQTLKVPHEVAGTDLRPVLTLMPVPTTGEHGGAEASDDGGGKVGTIIKGLIATALVGHLAVAGMALREAISTPDIIWDTAGIAKKSTITKIALVPGAGAANYKNEVKPKLDQAADAMRLQGG